MVVFIIVLLIVGFIVGAIARLLMPGRDPVGILGTIVLGVAGSFMGAAAPAAPYPAGTRPPPLLTTARPAKVHDREDFSIV